MPIHRHGFRQPGSFDVDARNHVIWMREEDHAYLVEGLRKPGWQRSRPD